MGLAIQLRHGERCRICGKPDFCYRLPIPADLIPEGYIGDDFYSVCNRTGGTVSVGDIVIGVNGEEYRANKSYAESGDCVSVGIRFEPAALKKARQKNWADNKGEVKPRRFKTYADEEIVPENPPADDATLDHVYREFLSLLRLEPEDRTYLHKEGFTDGLIDYWKIVSVPESDYVRYQLGAAYHSINDRRKITCQQLLQRVPSLEHIPGFRQTSKGDWTYCGYGGIIFPLFNAKGQIYALRVRNHSQYHDKDGFAITKEAYEADPENNFRSGKYVNFTSFGKDGCKIGCRAGIYLPRSRRGEGFDKSRIWCTEGEKKSIIGSEMLRNTFIDIPGVSSYKLLTQEDKDGNSILDYMWNSGALSIVVAYDADKENNRMVLHAQDGFVELLKQRGFRVLIADWDINIGKGIDDLLRNGGLPHLTSVN